MTARSISWDVVERRTPRPVRVAGEVERLVLSDLDVPEGTDGALCAQTDPELFFPEKGGSTRDAKKVCRRCPVRAECLEYALTHDQRFGIWGGLSERELRRVRRMRQAGWTIKAARDSVTADASELSDSVSLVLVSPERRRAPLDAWLASAAAAQAASLSSLSVSMAPPERGSN